MRTRLLSLAVVLVLGCQPAATPPPPPASSGPAPTATPVISTQPAPSLGAAPSTPTIEAADLDGVLTAPELAHRLPLVVSIDDSAAARPQSGFNAASMVWQAPADGYESRYLLFFQEGEASEIGPVRSARIYLAQWAAELGAALAHHGGDRLTRGWLAANTGKLVTSVDGLGRGNSAFHRIRSRRAPHNAYTSSADLRRVAIKIGAPEVLAAAFHRRPFRDDSPATDRGTSQSMTIPYNTVRVRYDYDPSSNAYLRSINGDPQIDPADDARVVARTVIVLYMSFRTDSTIEPGHNRPVLGFVGTGKATVFMEGRAIEATWSKDGPTDPTLILGADGQEIPLLRGRIFVQVVAKSTKVSVTD
jgi:hypothetical protein